MTKCLERTPFECLGRAPYGVQNGLDVQDGHHTDVQDRLLMNVHDRWYMDFLNCGKMISHGYPCCPVYTKWLSSEHLECPAEDIRWISNGLSCVITVGT